jgi:hypothetical protein
MRAHLPVQMLQFSHSIGIPLAVVFFKHSVDFVHNHIGILVSGVADEIKAGLRKGDSGGIDLFDSEWPPSRSGYIEIQKLRTAAKKIPRYRPATSSKTLSFTCAGVFAGSVYLGKTYATN